MVQIFKKGVYDEFYLVLASLSPAVSSSGENQPVSPNWGFLQEQNSTVKDMIISPHIYQICTIILILFTKFNILKFENDAEFSNSSYIF